LTLTLHADAAVNLGTFTQGAVQGRKEQIGLLSWIGGWLAVHYHSNIFERVCDSHIFAPIKSNILAVICNCNEELPATSISSLGIKLACVNCLNMTRSLCVIRSSNQTSAAEFTLLCAI